MEAELLNARIKDTAEISRRTNKPKYLGFLSAEQSVFARKVLEYCGVKYDFYGGYDNAERVMLGCFPDWAVDLSYPINSLTFRFKKEYNLTHRDFLGSLMSLGITRESVGDILVEEGRAVVFLTTEVKDFVLAQIVKIGKVGVILEEGFKTPLPENGKLKDFTDTISSSRLDCVVSAIVCVSRGKASELIENGLVTVNSVLCQKCTKEINEKDIITVRGKGKFIICSLSAKTKKQRTVLEYKKYV